MKTFDQVQKAEVFLSMQIDKLDAFAKRFGLDEGWWQPKELYQSGEEKVPE